MSMKIYRRQRKKDKRRHKLIGARPAQLFILFILLKAPFDSNNK